MNCNEYKELFVEYIEGLLDESQKQDVAKHLNNCQSCQAELLMLKDLQERLIINGKAVAQSNLEEKVLSEILRQQRDRLKAVHKAGTGLKIWRTIMKNQITKLAIAAVVVIACLIGFSLWRTTGSGIALADVLAQIEQAKAVRYKLNNKITSEDPNSPYNFESRVTFLKSGEYGMKVNFEQLDPNGGESTFTEHYFLPQKKTWIAIFHKDKRYQRVELDDASFEFMQEQAKQANDPLFYLKEILKYKYESLGKSTIDGIEVVGFQSKDPNYTAGVTTLLVEVKTLLPVRYESLTTEPNKRKAKLVLYDFQWDVPVDASEFDPVIPDGYTVRLAKFPAKITEETAIQGLKIWVELLGKYPDPENIITNDVAPTVLRLAEKSETPTAMRLKEDSKGLTDDEISNKLVDFLMPIRGLGSFYLRLSISNKDLAYYGKTVTSKDMNKVLMRWKVSDNQYRIIYGDLHAETVTPEKLAELEKNLPK
jgi:hypothetical protein